jgi:transposase
MKVQEVILRALSGRQSWLQVADVLGVSPRTVRRLRLRYQHVGYDGLFDRRRRRSPRAVAVEEVQRVLRLYRDRYGPRDGHPGFNVRHFVDVARKEHDVQLSYSFIKQALQTAGLVGKRRPRGRHRRGASPGPASANWSISTVVGIGGWPCTGTRGKPSSRWWTMRPSACSTRSWWRAEKVWRPS